VSEHSAEKDAGVEPLQECERCRVRCSPGSDWLAGVVATARAEGVEQVIDAIEETFLGQLPSKALSYCAQEDVNAGLDALRERFGIEDGGR
jgi:hypothetical protein